MPEIPTKRKLSQKELGKIAGGVMMGAAAIAGGQARDAEGAQTPESPLDDPYKTHQAVDSGNPESFRDKDLVQKGDYKTPSMKEHIEFKQRLSREQREKKKRVVEQRNTIALDILDRMGINVTDLNIPAGDNIADHCTWVGDIMLTAPNGDSTESILTPEEKSRRDSLQQARDLMSGDMSPDETKAYYDNLDKIDAIPEQKSDEMNIDEESQNYGVFGDQSSKKTPENKDDSKKKESPHIKSGVSSVI